MTVIAYSSAAGGPVRGILPLEHLSTSRNCAKPLSKIFEAQTMLQSFKCPHGKDFGVDGKKWIGKPGGKTEAEEHGVKCRKVAGDGGGKKVKRGLKDEGCHGRNLDINRGGWRRCVESKREAARKPTASETEGAIKKKADSKCNRWKKRPFCLNNICVEDVKTTRRMHHRRLHAFLWFTTLLFSLCPKMASSQVRK